MIAIGGAVGGAKRHDICILAIRKNTTHKPKTLGKTRAAKTRLRGTKTYSTSSVHHVDEVTSNNKLGGKTGGARARRGMKRDHEARFSPWLPIRPRT